MIRFSNPLVRVAQRLKTGEPITIIAIGSSSTAGTGANLFSRLLSELARGRTDAAFPWPSDHRAQPWRRWLGNRRHARALWYGRDRYQSLTWSSGNSGTNSVIRDDKLNNHDVAILKGLTKIRSTRADTD